MALKLISNTAWRDCAQLSITDTSHAETTSEKARAINVTGGPRSLSWTQSGTGDRIISYINKAGTLAADTLVVTRANNFNGHEVRVRSYSTYSSTPSDILNTASFAQSLVGPDGTDWVYEFSAVASKQALSLYLGAGSGGAYTKTVGAVYFSTALSLDYPSSMTIGPLDSRTVHVVHGNAYRVHRTISLQFSMLTQAQVQTIEQFYKMTREPIFIYDSTGNWIFRNLAYVAIVDVKRLQRLNDFYPISLELVELNGASSTHS